MLPSWVIPVLFGAVALNTFAALSLVQKVEWLVAEMYPRFKDVFRDGSVANASARSTALLSLILFPPRDVDNPVVLGWLTRLRWQLFLQVLIFVSLFGYWLFLFVHRL